MSIRLELFPPQSFRAIFIDHRSWSGVACGHDRPTCLTQPRDDAERSEVDDIQWKLTLRHTWHARCQRM